jgi:hypothetical protein
MVKVIFKFDKEKDLFNNWDLSNCKKSSWANISISEEARKICENKTFEECKKELSDYTSNIHNSPFIKLVLASWEEAWKIIEKEFFKRMDKVMKNKFTENISAYLTTSKTCPYDPDEGYFMISFFSSIPRALSTCGHEIMHLYFHKFYWDKVEKEIGKEKTEDLKEALTVLLNLEFKDLWFMEDMGYEPHKELREFIAQEWEKEKDFDVLLDKCVKYLKKRRK